jgi:hypothetical protein
MKLSSQSTEFMEYFSSVKQYQALNYTGDDELQQRGNNDEDSLKMLLLHVFNFKRYCVTSRERII